MPDSSEKQTSTSHSKRRWPRFKLIVIASGAAALSGWGYWYWTIPARLTRQAAAALPKHPHEAERIAGMVVDDYDRHFSSAWLVRAQALLRLNQPAEALGCFSMIAAPERCTESELLATAEAAWSVRHTVLAELCVAAAVQSGSRSVEVARWALRTRPARVTETELRALADLLVASEPKDPADWQLIGQAHHSWSELAKELAAYQRAVNLLNDDSSSKTLQLKRDLARLLINLGEYATAKPLVDAVRNSPEHDLDDDVRHATLLRADGGVAEALVILDEIIDQEPNHFDARLLRGIMRADQRNDRDAISDLTIAVQRNPYHPTARYRLAMLLNRVGDAKGSEDQLRQHKRLSEAQLELLTASSELRLNPHDTALMRRLSALHSTLGQSKLAEQWSQAAAKTDGVEQQKRP